MKIEIVEKKYIHQGCERESHAKRETIKNFAESPKYSIWKKMERKNKHNRLAKLSFFLLIYKQGTKFGDTRVSGSTLSS